MAMSTMYVEAGRQERAMIRAGNLPSGAPFVL
jgi:hypothetical protein